jgi:hypothetical protein
MSDRRQPIRRLHLDGFALASLYGAICVIAAIWLLRDAIANKLIWALQRGTGDCVVNWLGARAFERGIDPYSKAGLAWAGLPALGHPPTTPLWYLPFTAYGIVELNQVFGQLLLVMLLVHVLLLAIELRAPVPLATALLAYTLVMDTTFWRMHVANIQLSEPIALLYVLAWIFLRRRHATASGIAIGLAMTLKPYAGLLLLLFILARRWRALVAALSTYAVAALIATWRFGFSCWREFAAALPATQALWTATRHNASVQGIVARWWHPACREPAVAGWQATFVALLLDLVIVALIAWMTRRALATAQPDGPVDDEIDLPFALLVTASAWLNPVVWEHYSVTLLQPIAVAAAATARLAQRRDARWLAPALALLVSIVLLGIDVDAKDQAVRLHQHMATHFYEVANWLPWPLVLATLAALLVLRRSARPAHSS